MVSEKPIFRLAGTGIIQPALTNLKVISAERSNLINKGILLKPLSSIALMVGGA
jgi:hypothetical protein